MGQCGGRVGISPIFGERGAWWPIRGWWGAGGRGCHGSGLGIQGRQRGRGDQTNPGTSLQELEAIKARVREMEEEAEKLKELQNEVEKQMNMSPPPGNGRRASPTSLSAAGWASGPASPG